MDGVGGWWSGEKRSVLHDKSTPHARLSVHWAIQYDVIVIVVC